MAAPVVSNISRRFMASLLRKGSPEGVNFRRAYRLILTRVDADAIRDWSAKYEIANHFAEWNRCSRDAERMQWGRRERVMVHPTKRTLPSCSAFRVDFYFRKACDFAFPAPLKLLGYPVNFALLFSFSNNTHVVSLGIPRVRGIASLPTPRFLEENALFRPDYFPTRFDPQVKKVMFARSHLAWERGNPERGHLVRRVDGQDVRTPGHFVANSSSQIFVFPAFIANRLLFPKDT
jgi:hypothetical protein